MGLALAMLPLIGLVALTSYMGEEAHRDGFTLERIRAERIAAERGPAKGATNARALALAAVTGRRTTPGGKPSASEKQPPRTQVPPPRRSFLDRFMHGRAMFSAALACSARQIRSEASDYPRGVWITLAVIAIFAILACFFAWPLRRPVTALLGALSFGWPTFELARACGMGWSGAVVVSLPTAFLGALVAWHLMVLYITMLSGAVIGCTAALLVLDKFGAPSWLPVPIMFVLLGSVATATIYLLALRPALISGWAALGALLITSLLVLSLGSVTRGAPLWDLFLATFALLVIVGTITQYRLASRGGELSAEAAGAASTSDGQKMLRRLRREAAAGD
jgi:hypothetical protein